MELDFVKLCGNITMIRMEHCTNTTRMMVSVSSREPKNLVSNDECCLCVSGARYWEAVKDKVDPAERVQYKCLVPEPQRNLDLEGKLGSNLYGFSPKKFRILR